MKVLLALLCVGTALAQITVRLELQNAIGMTQKRLGASLAQADLAIAGEPWSQLVRYEDQVLGIRALDSVCAGGYFWTGSKCSMCSCVNAPSAINTVNFEVLDYSRSS